MTLEELSKNIIATEKVANMDVEEIPPPTRGAWGTKITEAKARLAELTGQYRGLLLRNGVAIFLNGDPDKAQQFAALVRSEGEGLVADANALYTRLAKDVEPTLAEATVRQWGTTQTHRLHLALQEVMHELKLTAIDMPARDQPMVPTFNDVVDNIRRLIRNSNGDEMNRLYVEEQAAKDALAIRYMGSLAPTLILNASDDEKNVLGSGFAKGMATVTVSSEDNIDKEFLIKTFKQVNKSIRKSK